VEVTETQELLRTDSGELSNTLSMQEVNTLPISSLNPYALATTLPGVAAVKSVDLTNGTSFSVNGSRPRDNNFLIEGMDNNDQAIHGQGSGNPWSGICPCKCRVGAGGHVPSKLVLG
jgi:hypothetical protein